MEGFGWSLFKTLAALVLVLLNTGQFPVFSLSLSLSLSSPSVANLTFAKKSAL